MSTEVAAMGKIIAVSNQKGGVGKSTTVVNLAAALGGKGKKVLVVDIDAQGNTTTGFGVRKKSVVNTVYEVIIGECSAAEAVVPTAFKGVSLITSAQKLAGAEIELASMDNRLMRLKMQLLTIKDRFDYILIDCTPSLGMLTINALAAADSVIIPVQAQYLPLKGLEQLMRTIGKVKRQLNPHLAIDGILLTMTDSRTNLSKDVSSLLRENYGKQVRIFKSEIPYSVKAAEPSIVGKSIYT